MERTKEQRYTNKKYKTGDYVPELFGLIDSADVKILLRGNKEVGGPIDLMYIGPMDVKFVYKNGECTLNGNFYSIDEYYKKVGGKLYIRARKRREDQPFTKDEVDKNGLPLIYGKSKGSPDKGRRIVVADKGMCLFYIWISFFWFFQNKKHHLIVSYCKKDRML